MFNLLLHCELWATINCSFVNVLNYIGILVSTVVALRSQASALILADLPSQVLSFGEVLAGTCNKMELLVVVPL